MPKRTDFARRLKRWQAGRRAKECAAILGVGLKTYRNWLYGISQPSDVKCRQCIDRILGRTQ